ncbi:MAG: hypothetical protein N0E39_06700 [Candidatus Thiodiazotropha lotti]|nr:hypothetical protein [Candidatus Thiodiazotropha lotti]
MRANSSRSEVYPRQTEAMTENSDIPVFQKQRQFHDPLPNPLLDT